MPDAREVYYTGSPLEARGMPYHVKLHQGGGPRQGEWAKRERERELELKPCCGVYGKKEAKQGKQA